MASYGGGKYGVDDMVMLSKISEDTIMDNLKKRYDNDAIYTYIGHVLISLNPFKQIKGLYLERTLKDYRGKYRYELPPHIYALADDMYRQMLSEGENQCVIISGESGAGKTEASKVIMQYIAAVSGKSEEVVRVKDIILESNPLLEAFGNAKTLRNNNSSRFGKYMEIQFDRKGDPEGGRVTNYLLEKSRVIFQTTGERNFHIFYQLLAGASAQDRQTLSIEDHNFFNYLNKSGCYTVDGMNDTEEFAATLNAMKAVGIQDHERQSILRLLMAILWIGQLTFKPKDDDSCYVDSTKALEIVAYLLESDSSACERSFCYRTITSGTTDNRRSTYACPQTVEGALYSRDALAKALYSRLFDWIIHRLNDGLEKNDPDSFTIGVLDIYGFEIFDRNGFEQLCINYVNEKLQQIFIELTLKTEQEEYASENIPWEPIPYFNNKICCDLIESKKPIGVLSLLDDVCAFPKGTDAVYYERLMKAFVDHPHLHGGDRDFEFVIKHYAGDVSYSVEGFIDKNKDLLFNDLMDLASSNTNSTFLPQLFPEVRTADDKRRPTTAGFKIKESIGYLMKALGACNPHYIRCIKPNNRKARNDFDNALVLHQVRYLGLLENVRVRRAGYAYRQTYDKFFYRYRVTCSKTWPQYSGDHRSGCLAILDQMHLEPNEYQQGTTKIFIRHPETVFNLEELRERTVFTYANKIQRFFLQFSLRRYFWEVAVAGNNVIQGKKERRRVSIDSRVCIGDYINYRENFQLKALINQSNGGSGEKLLFADNVNKYDRRSRRQRRILVITTAAAYFLSISRNKDKATVKKQPWAYILKRRVPLSSIKTLTLTTAADNFLLIGVPGDHDNLIDNRRKIEIVATIQKSNPSVSVVVQDSITVGIKKGGKRTIGVTRDPNVLVDGGKLKGRKICVAPGLSKDSPANLPEPKQAATVSYAQQQGKGFIERKKPTQQGAEFRPGLNKAPTPAASRALPSAPSPNSAQYGQNSVSSKPAPMQRFTSELGSPSPKATPAKALSPVMSQQFNKPQGAPSYGKQAPRVSSPAVPSWKAGPGPAATPPKAGPASYGSPGATRGPAPAAPKAGPAGGASPANPKAAPGKVVVKAQVRMPSQKAPPPPQARQQLIAMFDFEAENPDELTFKEGAVITLTEKVDVEWWKGIYNGFEGLFPKCYVKEMDPPPVASPPPKRATTALSPSPSPSPSPALSKQPPAAKQAPSPGFSSSRGGLGGPSRGGTPPGARGPGPSTRGGGTPPTGRGGAPSPGQGAPRGGVPGGPRGGGPGQASRGGAASPGLGSGRGGRGSPTTGRRYSGGTTRG